MSPTKAGTANEKDALFMMNVLDNMEGKPKVDWNAVAVAMNLKSGVVANVRFSQIKKKLGWKAIDVPTSGATVTAGFTPINKVTKKKASKTGNARVKRARKASTHKEDTQDDEEGSGDAEAKEDNSDEIKHEDGGKGSASMGT